MTIAALSGLPDGTPILCRGCGGRMELHGNLAIECRHCGSVDTLPSDEIGRVLEIKSRLRLAEERALQVRGVDATLAAIFEDRMAFVRVSGLYSVIALLVVATTVTQMISLPGSGTLPAPVLIGILASQAMGPILVLGIGLSFAFALAHGRWYYRRALRPLLLARFSPEPGARARCRVCGGELPEARGVDVRCEYCRSLNLIPRELHGARVSALAAEAESLRAKLSGVNLATLSIAKRMRLAMFGFVGLSIAAALALPALARVLFPF